MITKDTELQLRSQINKPTCIHPVQTMILIDLVCSSTCYIRELGQTNPKFFPQFFPELMDAFGYSATDVISTIGFSFKFPFPAGYK